MSGSSFGQDPSQFLPNTFAADLMNLRGHRAHRAPCFPRNGVTEPSAETDRSQDAQFVLCKPRIRITNGSHDSGVDIGSTIDVINHFACQRVIQEAVDCEITSQYVLLRVRENDAAGMSAIDI